MVRFLVLLGFITKLIASPFEEVTPSSPSEIASLNRSSIVDGYVSAISGQLVISEVDLHVRGAQDLIFTRNYIPPQFVGRSNKLQNKIALAKAFARSKNRGWIVLPHLWAGYNINSQFFQLRDPQGTVLQFEIQGNKGVLKTAAYGCSNLASLEPSSKADIRNIELFVEKEVIRVLCPDGTERVYHLFLPKSYRLEKEILPNGKVIRYEWNKETLKRISATDPSGKYLYAYIEWVKPGHFIGSDGREVELLFEVHKIKARFKDRGGKGRISFDISLMKEAKNPFYSNKIVYDEQLLISSYDAASHPIFCKYFQKEGELSRIHTFSTSASSSVFSYDPPIAGKKGGSTTVTYPNGASVIYRFNASLLLISLENWYEGKLYNQRVFTYDDKQHIQEIKIQDNHLNTILTKTYQCDAFGNPLLETHTGDFGSFSIERTFSKNRLVSEKREDGLRVVYSYLKDTHLPLSKETFMDDKVIRKTSYLYDAANNLIQKKEEGKTITAYHLFQEGPHLHRLHIEEKQDWNRNLIHKIRYEYDTFGNTVKEDHYGSDGKLAYTIRRVYDKKGNLLEETNPIKQKATFVYDERNRPIVEIPFSNQVKIEKAYDQKGRLTIFKKGKHKTSIAYTFFDKPLQKIDYLGVKTEYTYHPVHKKPTRIEKEGTVQEITYDSLGREITKQDAYGACTRITYNSYGNPVEIVFPDQGKQTFSYAPNGLLLEKTDPDGLKTTYSYDPLRRLVCKKEGEYETSYVYDAYNLIEEKDPLGFSTLYTYNLADLKIQEQRAHVVSEFTYDSLGFLSSKSTAGRKTSFKNDLLGRVLEKDVDGVLKTVYTYDVSGNVSSINTGNPIFFSYDPYDRLIEKINGEKEKTKISYEEKRGLLIKTIQDPKGVLKIETYNGLGLLIKREIPGVRLEEFSYDKEKRLITQDHLQFTYTLQGFLSSMCEGGKKTTYWTYTPGGKVQSKQKPDGTLIPYEYNSQGELVRVGSREFRYDALGRVIQGSGFIRELDPFGNILQEELSTGTIITSSYDEFHRPIKRILPDKSTIIYEYEGPFLKQVIRKGLSLGYLYNSSYEYTHTYNQYDEKGRLLEEEGAFTSQYGYDTEGRLSYQKCPYLEESLKYDLSGNLIQKGESKYVYDDASQLISEEGKFEYGYDLYHNRIWENGEEIPLDNLHQRRDLSYDLNGNLVKEGFVYDEFDQLVQTKEDRFTYDALGRRISSIDKSYFYLEEEEIGSFQKGQILELKVMGDTRPVAIEIKGKPFAPVIDMQNTIRKLIDWKSKEVAFDNPCDAFGKGLSGDIPYAYVSKRYDASSGLVYFGKRFYDPTLGKWLTPDPLRNIDHSNLYQYVFNNPFKYYDPNGEFAIAIPILVWGAAGVSLPAISTLAIAAAYGTAAGVVAYGGYKFIESMNSQDIKVPNISWKNTNVYTPDRPLPLTEDGIPIPETDVPHTQLGTRDGSKGKYPQAREFGKDGKPLKGIDFTDHGRPWDHPNPHEHPYEPNPTGGTPGRGNAKPLKNWRY